MSRRAKSKIIEGLEDAVAYAKGDRSKATTYRYVKLLFCDLPDGRFKVTSPDIPGLLLIHKDRGMVWRDLGPAMQLVIDLNLKDVPSKSRRGTRRTTHRSSKGKKLYAVRDKDGRFEDIQTYKRAHGSDVKRKSKAERAKKRGRA